MPNRRLRKSNDHVFNGVIGGIAEYFGWDPTPLRIIYALLTIFTCFSGIIVYLILSFVMPSPKSI